MEYGEEEALEQSQSPKRGHKLFSERRKNTILTRREKLPWPSDRPFKILSLDGGGIRGLYGACLLALIEKEMTDVRSIADFFYMIAGTSTGGIMALGLGLKIPAIKIEHLYREDGKKIFHQPWYWRIPALKFLRHCRRALYDHKALENLLYREFGDQTLGEASTRLIIPAFMTPKTEIAVFKTDHHPDYKNDHKSKVWEIARATSAAPTYLSGHDSDNIMFLDGGVWANCPIMAAVVDALSAYDITREQIEILSIGTGNSPFEITLKNAKKGLWDWKEVIKGAMFLTTDNALAQAALLLGPDKITRLEPSQEAAGIDLDDWASSAHILPSMATNHFIAHKDNLERFFDTLAQERNRFYSNGPNDKISPEDDCTQVQ